MQIQFIDQLVKNHRGVRKNMDTSNDMYNEMARLRYHHDYYPLLIKGGITTKEQLLSLSISEIQKILKVDNTSYVPRIIFRMIRYPLWNKLHTLVYSTHSELLANFHSLTDAGIHTPEQVSELSNAQLRELGFKTNKSGKQIMEQCLGQTI